MAGAAGERQPRASILALGCYIPRTRIARSTLAEMWSAPAMPGERAVAGADEDAVTMGVEAGLNCLMGRERTPIDAIYFASTSAPYLDRQGSAIIAAALDAGEDVATADFGDSLRAGITAVRAACDAVESARAKNVLVVVSDRRFAQPETSYEPIFGDGAASVLIGEGRDEPGLGDIIAAASVSEDVTSGWRRAEDRYVHSFSPRHEVEFGFARPLVRALTEVVRKASIDPAQARLAVPSPDGRSHFKVARELGLPAERIADPLVLFVGALGTPASFVALADALQAGSIGDVVLWGAAGEGAEALAIRVRDRLPAGAWRPSDVHAQRRVLASYGEFVRANKLMDLPAPRIEASPVSYWRDRRQFLNLHGMRCGACALVQYPPARVCQRCHATDQSEEVPLARRGSIFTFTLDHVVASTYSATPVVRAIVDLEGGGRILTQVTDCNPDEISVGMGVELTFRRLHDAGDFKNYYWKARVSGSGSRLDVTEGAVQ